MAGVPNCSATSSRRQPPTVRVPSPSRPVPGGKRPSSSSVVTSVWIVSREDIASACHWYVERELTAKKVREIRGGCTFGGLLICL